MAATPPPARGVHSARPAAHWEESFLTGNGRHGALVDGGTWRERVVVTHHRLVRPMPDEVTLPPEVAGVMPEVAELVLAGRSEEAVARCTDGFAQSAPRPFHPALAVRTEAAPDGAPAPDDYLRWTDLRTGVVGTAWTDRDGEWTRTCFVSRSDDVVVQRLRRPRPVPRLVVRHDARLPGSPEELAVTTTVPSGGRAPGSAVLVTAVDHPSPGSRPADVGGYLVATRVVVRDEAVGAGTQAGTGEADPAVEAVGADEVLLLSRVAVRSPGESGELLRTRLLDDLARLPQDHETLLSRHVGLHTPVMDRVRLDLGASAAERALAVEDLLARPVTPDGGCSPALLERLFDTGRYLLLSASDLLPPRLVGLWQGDWHAAWSGALTLDANLPLQLAGAVTTDVREAVHALAGFVAAQLPDWRTNARRIFGARGAVAPAHTDGRTGLTTHFEPAYPLHLWTAGADWLLTTLLDHVDATGDLDFLRRRVLPALRAVAEFYADVLRDPGDGGVVTLVPSYSPENRPLGAAVNAAAAVDATMDVAAARHALTRAARWCRELGEAVPQRDVARWEDLARRLPDYRVNADGALAEWVRPGLADRYAHRHVSHLYPVWPLHEISPDTDPRLAAAARRALRLRTAEDSSAHGLLHRALAAARLRDADHAADALRTLLAGDSFFPSLMSSHYPGRRVFNADAACALPGVLTELLLGSSPATAEGPARIELLPALPGRLPTGSLHGAMTRAGVRIGELSWDLPAGRVTVELVSPVPRRVTVSCRLATGCPPAADDAPSSWPVDLPAGVPVRLRLTIPTRVRPGDPGHPDAAPAPTAAPVPTKGT